MDDSNQLKQLIEEIKIIKEKIDALEREQRMIREDILSGNAKEHMKKRMLQNPVEKMVLKKEKIDKEIKIEI